MVYYVNHFVLQPERIESLDDVKRVLAALNIAFDPDFDGLERIKDLCVEQRKPGSRFVYD